MKTYSPRLLPLLLLGLVSPLSSRADIDWSISAEGRSELVRSPQWMQSAMTSITARIAAIVPAAAHATTGWIPGLSDARRIIRPYYDCGCTFDYHLSYPASDPVWVAALSISLREPGSKAAVSRFSNVFTADSEEELLKELSQEIARFLVGELSREWEDADKRIEDEVRERVARDGTNWIKNLPVRKGP